VNGLAEREYASRLKTNLRDRVNALMDIPNNAVTMAETMISKTKETKPVQGVIEAAKKAGDGSLEFLRKQCEITRRWK
jgi:hypothetical protein